MTRLESNGSTLIRIGIFYDGNYFFHVSNYYLYHHARRSRISINGLHQFIMTETARMEKTSAHLCRIVDTHYFRGRISAHDAQARDLLYRERIFEDILMRENVITHYLPLSPDGEKGIDVWLALESFELALHKNFDVLVLIAADGDYLPLVRKLNTVGTRVMVLGWDFSFVDHIGNERETRTSQALLESATYPIIMSTVIDSPARRNDPVIENLFVKDRNKNTPFEPDEPEPDAVDSEALFGTIVTLREGYGFIHPGNGGDNLFFYYGDIVGCDFNDLKENEQITFVQSENERGPCAKNVKRVAD